MMMPKDLWDAMTSDQRWEAAQAAFSHDDMEFAKSLYLNLLPDLATRPDYEFARIMGRLGIAFCRTGDPEAGIRFFRQGAQVLAARILASEVLAVEHAVDNAPAGSPDKVPTRGFTGTQGEDFARLQAQLLYNIGITQRYLGRTDEAVEALFQAHRLDVENGEILIQLGQIYYEAGFPSHACTCFQVLTQVQPGNPAGWLTLGYIAAQVGDHDEARNCFETAIRLDPLLWNDCFEIARSLNPHFQRAVTVLRSFLDETRPDAVRPEDLDILATAAVEAFEESEAGSQEPESPSIFSFDDYRSTEEPQRRAA